jgi:hypothetical protein
MRRRQATTREPRWGGEVVGVGECDPATSDSTGVVLWEGEGHASNVRSS